MACRLFGAKPLPEAMLAYCQLYPYEQNSVKFKSKDKTFQSWKYIWKCRLRNDKDVVQEKMSQPSRRWSYAWMGNHIQVFYMDVITNPCPNRNAGLANLRK